MQRHLGADVVEQYVMGALDVESSRFVETHVAQCEACARVLQEEAMLEVALHEVASLKKVVSLADRRRRRLGAVAASAAVAAAAALVVVLSFERPPPHEKSPRFQNCTEASTARDCISRAQFDGVITIGPNRQPIVPRYDLVGSSEGAVP